MACLRRQKGCANFLKPRGAWHLGVRAAERQDGVRQQLAVAQPWKPSEHDGILGQYFMLCAGQAGGSRGMGGELQIGAQELTSRGSMKLFQR